MILITIQSVNFFFEFFKNYITHLKECFIQFPNTLKLLKKLRCTFFNPFLCDWKSDQTLFLVFDGKVFDIIIPSNANN